MCGNAEPCFPGSSPASASATWYPASASAVSKSETSTTWPSSRLQRGEDPDRRPPRRRVVHQRHADAHGGAARLARHGEQTGERLHQRVVAGLLAERPRPERVDPAVDARRNVLRAEPEPLRGSRPQARDEHVGALGEAEQLRTALPVLQVEDERPLAAFTAKNMEGPRRAPRRRPAARPSSRPRRARRAAACRRARRARTSGRRRGSPRAAGTAPHKGTVRSVNRLAEETSPYLLQHADNPVDWYPWGEEARARAREEDKPILLSVGYSACHWCHVMEHESFEDEETARLMNERFVNVKVDREERPDVDAVYMDAVVALSGHGGWPMTVFLTPGGRAVLRRDVLPARAAARAAELPAAARRGVRCLPRAARRREAPGRGARRGSARAERAAARPPSR